MTRPTFVQTRSNKRPDLITRNPIYKAFSRKPVTHDKWASLSVDARMSFARFELGTPQPDDRATLACTVNITMVLAEKHSSDADLDGVTAARDAMGRADSRAARGLAWNFDATGREEMKHALEVHDHLIAILGQATLTDAILEMRARRDRGHVHQMEVAA